MGILKPSEALKIRLSTPKGTLAEFLKQVEAGRQQRKKDQAERKAGRGGKR